MMVFDQPGWLWGLLALAVPLAIHLLNATSGRPVPFPGQRFAVESPARRVRSLHLRQPWLLALRLTLFALLTLALAGPRWVEPAAAGGAGQWITPMALQAVDAELKESLLQENSAALVSPGLPPAAGPGAASAEPAGLLLKQLLAAEPADLPAKLTLTDHPLDRPWRLLGPEGFTVDEVKWRPGPLRVGLAVAADRPADGRYLRAALSALSSQGLLVWRELPDPDPVDILITLGTAPGIVPEHRLRRRNAKGKLLVSQREERWIVAFRSSLHGIRQAQAVFR
ncbi:MAG: BatA domain-containing protein, partial [Pseudomonadota bacterium]